MARSPTAGRCTCIPRTSSWSISPAVTRWPSADLWGASRVQRGGVDVIPANSLHRISNAGSDRLELLTIVPK